MVDRMFIVFLTMSSVCSVFALIVLIAESRAKSRKLLKYRECLSRYWLYRYEIDDAEAYYLRETNDSSISVMLGFEAMRRSAFNEFERLQAELREVERCLTVK